MLVQKNKTETEEMEYSVSLEKDSSYYCFEGIMEENEFIKIVADMNF